MRPSSACVSVTTLTCVCVYLVLGEVTATDNVDYYSDDSYDQHDTGSAIHQAIDRLLKFLGVSESKSETTGVQSDDPLVGSVVEERNISVDLLTSLKDEDIWDKITGYDKNSSVQNNSTTVAKDIDQFDVSGSRSIVFRTGWKDESEPSRSQKVRVVGKSRREEEERVLDALLRDDYQSDQEPGPKDAEGSATLAFVFDTTGSMWDDLVQVRHGAAKIMETMLERPDKPIYNYVLVPFHDPGKFVTVTEG